MNGRASDDSGFLDTLLIVDDIPANIDVLVEILRPKYRVKAAASGVRALEIARRQPKPSLILLDVMMPEMDGYEVCKALKADPVTHDIPVIFVTAMNQESDEEAGLAAGAVDYLAKPVSPGIVLARVEAHLAQHRHSQELERLVQERTRELEAVKDVTIVALASLAETRDNETGNHIRRTQSYMRLLAVHLRHHPRFQAIFTPSFIDLAYKCSPLHDIGKVGIPDSILLKPGKLTPEEFEIMKTHTTLGREALLGAQGMLQGPSSSFLTVAANIASCHHERWDGGGYPSGLAGDAIPYCARLMALADVYDALISERVYKPPLSHSISCDIIMQGKGTQFDPDMADAFWKLRHQFQAIAEEMADE